MYNANYKGLYEVCSYLAQNRGSMGHYFGYHSQLLGAFRELEHGLLGLKWPLVNGDLGPNRELWDLIAR